MTGPRGVVVLEGADCAGKTTLARHLVERHGARYLHTGSYREAWRYHTAALRLALRWADHGLVAVDRLFLSELVYGPIYRGAAAYDADARSMDRVLQRNGVTVLCAPSDPAAQLRRHADRFARGDERFQRIELAVQRFADLARGNVAHPGDGYLDQLVRFGDYAQRDDVLVYDWVTGGARREEFAQRVLRRLGRRRRRQHGPALDSRRPNVAGHRSRERGRFVGEAPSPARPAISWPWYGAGSAASAATYLNRALDDLGFDETRALWTNARHRDDQLAELLGLGLPVVALGAVARERVAGLGGEVSERRQLPHPQWWRRFRHHDRAGYVTLLREALR